MIFLLKASAELIKLRCVDYLAAVAEPPLRIRSRYSNENLTAKESAQCLLSFAQFVRTQS